jgi:hypothetical protein
MARLRAYVAIRNPHDQTQAATAQAEARGRRRDRRGGGGGACPPQPAISLHELFDQQTRAILESPDLDEEQKQNILVAMRCPCCGGASGTFSFKLKPRA